VRRKREQKKDWIAPICLVNQILENEYSFSMNRLMVNKLLEIIDSIEIF